MPPFQIQRVSGLVVRAPDLLKVIAGASNDYKSSAFDLPLAVFSMKLACPDRMAYVYSLSVPYR